MPTESLLPFEVLNEVSYLVQFGRIRESTDCFTHGAKLASRTLGQTDAFVKYYVDHGKTSRGLINEAVGYLLAKDCGLPVPAHAFIVLVSGERLREAHPALRGAVNAAGSYLCWATSAVHGAIFQPNQSSVIDSLRKWHLTPAMLAFDDWVLNTDRSTANIVLTGKQEPTLIDHGHIAGSLYWMADLLASDANFSSDIAGLIWPRTMPRPIASQVVERAKLHGRVFSLALPRLRAVLDLLLDDKDSQRALVEFLEKRANGGYERIKKTYGVLI